MTDEVKPLTMEGKGTLVIGRGRKGKTGFILFKILPASKKKKKLIIVPRLTNNALLKYDSIDWPIWSAEDLLDAFSESQTEALVVYIGIKEKGQPSIWAILRNSLFRDFFIFADELKILTMDSDDKTEFADGFIRVVGQNNQEFVGASHRITGDIPPVTVDNVQEVYYIGRTHRDDEIENLWKICSLDDQMDRETFEEKIKNQPEKYDWWNKHPNEAAAWLIMS